MTLVEFNTLDQNQKSDIVWEWGYHISQRKEGQFNVVLFLMGEFFAEVHINSSTNATENIVGVAKNELHKDFILALEQDRALVRATLLNPGTPFHIPAA